MPKQQSVGAVSVGLPRLYRMYAPDLEENAAFFPFLAASSRL
jgi:hypothetical protein